MTHRIAPLRLVATAVFVALAVVSAGCGSDHGSMDMAGMDMGQTMGTNPIAANAEFNGADVEFAQGMIVHHGQAVQMADFALTNSTDPAMLELAQKIKAAQEPEMAQMTAWLEAWGQPVPDPMMDHNQLDHGAMPMGGMVDQQQMSALQQASGAAFDEQFFDLMIQHHRGAVDMARYVIDNGTYPPVRQLADDVIRVQEAEIAEMEALLAQR
jgi:uncharacterized protein (DUF305 family)